MTDTQETIWLIHGEMGGYEDHQEWIWGWFTNKSDALAMCIRLNQASQSWFKATQQPHLSNDEILTRVRNAQAALKDTRWTDTLGPVTYCYHPLQQGQVFQIPNP